METGVHSEANKRARLILGMTSAVLCICLAGAVYVGRMFLLARITFDTPLPCVDGGPGEYAVFRNTGLRMFRFPKSATNIGSGCYTWHSASIYVWFDMAPTDQDDFVSSMRWKVGPFSGTTSTPFFGTPRPNATYDYGDFDGRLEGARVWIDSSSTPYHVSVYISLD